MKSPNELQIFSILALLTLICDIRPGSLHAQWFGDSTHNTVVCNDAENQGYPAGTSDGNNGAIIVWEDQRSGPHMIYAQHLGATGLPLWKKNGIQLCKSSVEQRFPIITTDNRGGAYVVWEDSRYSGTYGTVYYAQHIMADGTLGYPDTGLCVAVAPGTRQSAVICDDGNGSAFLAWTDNRSAVQATQPDIYINKLWPHGMKYNDSLATNSIGAVRKTGFGPGAVTRFYDGTAHFKSVGLGAAGASNVINSLSLYIVGKGKYDVETVVDDTTLTFKSGTYPATFETYRYYFKPWVGRVVDSSKAKQLNPAICGDGNGGCYLAWSTSNSTPVGIKGMHFDSACNIKWTRGYPDSAGYLLYKGSNYGDNASSLNVSLDTATKQLLMAWEVTNSQNSQDTQDIWVTRMNCATAADTSMAWASAQSITGSQLLNQVRPLIFSDDSEWVSLSGKHVRGVMTTFRTAPLGQNPSDWDIGMCRMVGDGSTIYPAQTSAGYKVVAQPLGQLSYKAVKVDTGKILVAWSDARFYENAPPDTCIYAQVIDKFGNRYLPTAKTGSTWGQPVTGHTNTGGWSARQVQLIPRASGAIAVWTDFRNGSKGDIYAQLIMKDGSLVLPYAKVAVTTMFTHGSDCNAQSASVTIADTAKAMIGFNNAAVVSSTNMNVVLAPVAKGQPVTFTTTVIDSMKDAQGVVSVTDTIGNVTFDTVSYCTINDVVAPAITTNSYTKQDIAISYTVSETRPWDRLLDTIKVTGVNYVLSPALKSVKGLATYAFTASQKDTLSSFVLCVTAVDAAGNTISRTCDSLPAKELAGQRGVAEGNDGTGTLRVYPNPSTDLFTISVGGDETLQQCDVLDVLGRSVAHFAVRGQATFDATSLPNGAYVLRVGEKTVSIVKQ
jgi:hypothetical protein